GPQAACATYWSESRKQACYYAALTPVRAALAARDATIAGGSAARDAIRNVHDDPKNEAVAVARAASEAAFAACDDDAGVTPRGAERTPVARDAPLVREAGLVDSAVIPAAPADSP
ncbi:MAG: hypothetical protein JOZ69_05455, partial [Myxococcales bacterium]|nr:hypothetical protein [Myxococcales bacterium]